MVYLPSKGVLLIKLVYCSLEPAQGSVLRLADGRRPRYGTQDKLCQLQSILII